MFEIISILNKNKYNKYFFFMYIFLKRTLEWILNSVRKEEGIFLVELGEKRGIEL